MSTQSQMWKPCLACDIDGATDLRSTHHPMESCDVWKSLSREGETQLKKFCKQEPEIQYFRQY